MNTPKLKNNNYASFSNNNAEKKDKKNSNMKNSVKKSDPTPSPIPKVITVNSGNKKN